MYTANIYLNPTVINILLLSKQKCVLTVRPDLELSDLFALFSFLDFGLLMKESVF